MWEALSSAVAGAKVHSAHHQQLALASFDDGGANNILAPLSPLLPYKLVKKQCPSEEMLFLIPPPPFFFSLHIHSFQMAGVGGLSCL